MSKYKEEYKLYKRGLSCGVRMLREFLNFVEFLFFLLFYVKLLLVINYNVVYLYYFVCFVFGYCLKSIIVWEEVGVLFFNFLEG